MLSHHNQLLVLALQGLPCILAESIGRDIEEIYRTSNRGILSEVDLLQKINQAARDCVSEFVKGRLCSLRAGLRGAAV